MEFVRWKNECKTVLFFDILKSKYRGIWLQPSCSVSIFLSLCCAQNFLHCKEDRIGNLLL